MNNTTKKFVSGAALAVLAAGVLASLPAVSAGIPGDLARTFTHETALLLTQDPPGWGIYGMTAGGPSPCPITQLGLHISDSTGLYFDRARILIEPSPVEATTGTLDPPFDPNEGEPAAVLLPGGNCPIPGSAAPTTYGYGLYLTDATYTIADARFGEDALICTQPSFWSCFASASTLTSSFCPANKASFTASAANDPKGLLSEFGLPGLNMQTKCSVAWAGTSGNLNGQLLSPLSTGFNTVSADSIATTEKDGYIGTCLTATYTIIDSSTIPPTISTSTTSNHDSFLYLDQEDAGNWATDIQFHLLGGGAADPLQGIYDLHGDNGCGGSLPMA